MTIIIPPGLAGTAPYRAVTSGTPIKHPHPAEPWMPSSCHRVPGTGNTLPYPRAGPKDYSQWRSFLANQSLLSQIRNLPAQNWLNALKIHMVWKLYCGYKQACIQKV